MKQLFSEVMKVDDHEFLIKFASSLTLKPFALPVIVHAIENE